MKIGRIHQIVDRTRGGSWNFQKLWSMESSNEKEFSRLSSISLFRGKDAEKGERARERDSDRLENLPRVERGRIQRGRTFCEIDGRGLLDSCERSASGEKNAYHEYTNAATSRLRNLREMNKIGFHGGTFWSIFFRELQG